MVNLIRHLILNIDNQSRIRSRACPGSQDSDLLTVSSFILLITIVLNHIRISIHFAFRNR